MPTATLPAPYNRGVIALAGLIFQNGSATADMFTAAQMRLVAAYGGSVDGVAPPPSSAFSDAERAELAATYPAFRPTPPSATERAAGIVGYWDTSTVPPVPKGWDGSAWVAVGGSPIPDGAIVSDLGDYLISDLGDYVIAA